MSLDLDRIRQETPGTKGLIHLNNAGSSLMPQPVYQAIIDHLDLEMKMGGYEAHARANPAVERTYDAIAELINCQRSEIALVENATAAWMMAFHGLDLQKGDKILTAEAEYASNIITYIQAERRIGIETVVVPSTPAGELDIKALEKAIDGRVKLISISHIPTNGGLINPAEEIGKVARKHNIPYLLDACQSVGQIPIDVEKIGCDMLSATGRKYLRGPRGTGFLYVRESFMDKLEPPFLDLHGATLTSATEYDMRPDARRFENWENNLAAVIGLGVAVDYFIEVGPEAASQRLKALATKARAKLNAVEGVTVQDIGEDKGGMVTFSHSSVDAATLKEELAAQNINVSTSTYSSTPYDMGKRGLPTLIRASFHYYNTEEEVETFIRSVQEILKEAKS